MAEDNYKPQDINTFLPGQFTGIGMYDEGGKFAVDPTAEDRLRAEAEAKGLRYSGDVGIGPKFLEFAKNIPDAGYEFFARGFEGLGELAVGTALAGYKGGKLLLEPDPEKRREIMAEPAFTKYMGEFRGKLGSLDLAENTISGITPEQIANVIGYYVGPPSSVIGGIVKAPFLAAKAAQGTKAAAEGTTNIVKDVVKSFTEGDSGFRASAGSKKGTVVEIGNESTKGTFKYKGETYNKSDGVKIKYESSRGRPSGESRWSPKEVYGKPNIRTGTKNVSTLEIENILKNNFTNDQLLNMTSKNLVEFVKSKGVTFNNIKEPTITVNTIRRSITGQKIPQGAPGVDRIPLDQKILKKPTSSLIKEFDEAGQIAINNFQDDMIKLTGFSKSQDQSMKVTSPLNRFLNGAVQALKKGDTTTDEIIEQLSKVDKDALANVLTKNAKIRNKLKKANELGIKLDDLNLSHMEDVADNWKTSLDANNLFLATKNANQKIQKNLDKDIKKVFENFREAKTISEKKEIVKEFKNIKQQLIDNDLVSVIDGKKIGADIDFEKSFEKFSSVADSAINKRLFKKDGGIMNINDITGPLGKFSSQI
jgi:hypothetical protein